jgi:hypothetical protein
MIIEGVGKEPQVCAGRALFAGDDKLENQRVVCVTMCWFMLGLVLVKWKQQGSFDRLDNLHDLAR